MGEYYAHRSEMEEIPHPGVPMTVPRPGITLGIKPVLAAALAGILLSIFLRPRRAS